MLPDLQPQLELDFSDDELDALLVPGAAPHAGKVAEVGPSVELLDVTRRISGQLLEVLVVTTRAQFAGRATQTETAELLATLESLRRLADAGKDAAGLELIAQARAATERFSASPNRRNRDAFLARLRSWLPAFADHLGPGEGARLRAIVEYDPRSVPLFSELAAIPGIGPRRLQRLFVAGLHAVDVVASASVGDLAGATGLPKTLAEDVIQRARSFQEAEQRRVLVDMEARLVEFQRALKSLNDAGTPELREAAARALEQMQSLVGQSQLRSER